MTFKQIKTIIRFRLNLILNTVFDVFSFCFEYRTIRKISEKIKLEKKLVVIVCDRYFPRAEKIAFALKNSDYKIILIHNFQKNINHSLYEHIFAFNGKYKAYWIAKLFKPQVYHIFSNWNFEVAEILIRKKPGKIVFDDYDVLAGMVKNNYINSRLPGTLEKERFCLENADGLCCRSIEIQYAKRNMGYKLKGIKNIFFPEYVWVAPETNVNKITKQNTIAYAGGIDIAIMTKFAKTIGEINWNLDIYSTIPIEKIKKLIPDNISVFDKIDNQLLIERIKEYPLALQVPLDIKDIDESVVYTANKKQYAMSGKMFDYIQANRTVIVSELVLISWLLKRYNFALLIDENNYFADLNMKILNYKYLNRNPAINNLTISVQIKRLIHFYSSI